MIRLYCEHCAHKISVRDEDAGRQGKCPKCGNVIVVPGESTVIEFHCEKCDRKISAPKSHVGKKAVCPKCKSTFIIPTNQFTGSAETRNSSGDLIAHTIDSRHDLTLLDVPEEYKLKGEPADQYKVSEEANPRQHESEEDLVSEETEFTDQRRLPWLVDIFLYPTSLSGFTHLAIFTIIPTLIAILRASLGKARVIVGLPGFIINILIFLYMGWYFTECVRDSAKGGTRAPGAFASVSAGEMWSQMQHIVGCSLILISPAFFYNLYTGKLDVAYWALLMTGSFFFPIGLLACIMFDSIRALNPKLLISSIFSTFFQYCGLVLLVIAVIFIFTQLVGMVETESPGEPSTVTLILGGVLFFLGLYIGFVIAHMIGRFYWRNQGKLNWEV
jgi:hypothetical protein